MTKKRISVTIPAIAIISWLILFRQWPRDVYDPNFYDANKAYKADMLVLLAVGITFIIGSITAFLSNLAFPVVKSRQLAIQFAMPSLLVYLFFYVITNGVTAIFDPTNRTLEATGFAIISFCLLAIPTGLLLAAFVAFFGWLGARVRMNSHKKA